MVSEDWLHFVSNFKEYIRADGYPVLLYYSFRSKEENNVSGAFRQAKAAQDHAKSFFNLTGDTLRSELYLPLISRYLSGLKNSKPKPDTERGEPADKNLSEYLSVLRIAPPELVLVCLTSSDPLIGNVREVLASARFQNCIDSELKNGQLGS